MPQALPQLFGNVGGKGAENQQEIFRNRPRVAPDHLLAVFTNSIMADMAVLKRIAWMSSVTLRMV